MNSVSEQAVSAIDSALLSRVAKGEQQAFGQLYDLSSPLLYSLALRILDNPEEAAQLLHDIYLDLWQKVSRYDVGRGTPIAWLIALTRTRALDRLRVQGTRTPRHNGRSPDLSHSTAIGEQDPTPFDAQADQELRRLVHTAMAGLPPAQQQTIELAYYDGLSHAEIAIALNEPLGTVKTRLKLGMSKLRESWSQYWEQIERS
ncbi:MAG: sigma-70 family RNA polymerase sigma factor [Nitrospira sp.]|nr:sigma-70 family RNA polymerase sigma factor [Nitrospira sp.]